MFDMIGDLVFRRRITGPLGTGRFRHQDQDVLLSEIGQRIDIHRERLIQEVIIEYEFRCVDDHAGVRFKSETDAVGDRLHDRESMDHMPCDLEFIAALDDVDVLVFQLVDLEIILQDLGGQSRRIDLGIHL